jgi:hypothetical protein
MSRTHRFASIASPDKVAYTYDNNFHGVGFCAVNEHMRVYDTYGDGMTAHSPAMPISIQRMADYLFSLAQAMLTDQDLRNDARYAITGGIPSKADLDFAFSVKFKEGKTRWYSRSERKVTSNPEKRHDKRYEEITSYHDGSIDGAFRVLAKDHYRGMESFALMHTVRKYVEDRDNTCHARTSGLLKWELGDDSYILDRAFEVCRDLILAYDLIDSSERGVKGFLRNLEQEREEKGKDAA